MDKVKQCKTCNYCVGFQGYYLCEYGDLPMSDSDGDCENHKEV